MKYDVAIVGGGPAGLTLGCFLKEKNKKLRVLLIEKEKPPYSRHLGGFLNRQIFDAVPFLLPHKNKLIDGEIQKLRFVSSDLKKEQIYSEGNDILGYLVHRTHFDNTLLDIAREFEVEFLFGEKVKKVSAGVEGAKIELGGSKKITAEALVGADGVSSVVASQMGIYENLNQFSLYHGYSILIPNENKSLLPTISLCFEKIPGYAFMWPLKEFLFIGLLSMEKEKILGIFSKWVEKLIQKGEIPASAKNVKPEGIQNPAGMALAMDRNYEKRTLLVGDAGGFCANTSGEGLYPSLYSSKIASQILLQGFQKENLDDVIPTYTRRWNLEFGEYIQGAIQLQANLSFLIDMIFSDPKICARYAKGFLFGQKVI